MHYNPPAEQDEPWHPRTGRDGEAGSAYADHRSYLGCNLQSLGFSLPSARFGACHRNSGLLDEFEDVDDDINI